MAIKFESNLGVALKGSEAAIARAAEIIGGTAESYAKQNLTANGSVRTGNLRNSITHSIEDDGKVVVIGSSVFYAPFVELGTGRSYEGSGGAGVIKGMAPKPYLRPAVEQHKEEYKEILINVLHNG